MASSFPFASGNNSVTGVLQPREGSRSLRIVWTTSPEPDKRKAAGFGSAPCDGNHSSPPRVDAPPKNRAACIMNEQQNQPEPRTDAGGQDRSQPESATAPSRKRYAVGGIIAAVLLATGLGMYFFRAHPDSLSSPDAAKPVPIADIRTRAETGDAAAQNILGECYLNGQQVKRDYREAVQWIRKAADQGLAEAQHNLGMLYEAGQGVPFDEAQAVVWYGKAAAQGLADSQYGLALLYATGRGTPKDKEASVRWFREAANQGLAEAQFNLAQRFEAGQGVATNFVEAFKWFTLAAAQGIPDATRSAVRLQARLSPEELAEARRAAEKFVPVKRARPAR